MKFSIERKYLLKPLQQINSPLGKRQMMPILSNMLLQVSDDMLSITGTDLEIEIVAHIQLSQPCESGATTISARKFFEICRSLPEGARIVVQLERDRILIRSGCSYFSLPTLPAIDFPKLDNSKNQIEFTILQKTMKRLIEATQFSMAFQDVRYYLNGMLFEVKENVLRTVATDGHRLAVCAISISTTLPSYSVIMPRKGVITLMRILNSDDHNLLRLQIGTNNICAHTDNIIFTSKLIDSQFPDYRQVLPRNPNKILESNCDTLKQAFSRIAIFSNDKFCIVHLHATKNQLKLTASNHKHEKAEETLDVIYNNTEIEIALNASYVLDVLKTLKCNNVRILLTDSMSSVQIEDATSKNAAYIIMPIRL